MNNANFSSSPDSQNEGNSNFSANYQTQNGEMKQEEKKPVVRLTFMQKIKEALRDWSAKDAQDQAYDDSRV